MVIGIDNFLIKQIITVYKVLTDLILEIIIAHFIISVVDKQDNVLNLNSLNMV